MERISAIVSLLLCCFLKPSVFAAPPKNVEALFDLKKAVCDALLPDVPDFCKSCDDEPGKEAECAAWADRGDCEQDGAIVQLCAGSCLTCSATPKFPTNYDPCKDHANYANDCPRWKDRGDCALGGLIKRRCGESCGICKGGKVNDPRKCFEDATFSTLSQNQQLALACGCYGNEINIYGKCCDPAKQKYYPGGDFSCATLPEPSVKAGPKIYKCCKNEDCPTTPAPHVCLCEQPVGWSWQIDCTNPANCQGVCAIPGRV